MLLFISIFATLMARFRNGKDRETSYWVIKASFYPEAKTHNVLGFEDLACEGRRIAGCQRQAIAGCIPAFAG